MIVMQIRKMTGVLSLWSIFVAGAPVALAGQATPSQQTEKQPVQPPTSSGPAAPLRVQFGGQFMGKRLVHSVSPKYPKEAKKQHIAGTVRMHILVDCDGKVIHVDVDSGDSLLAKAASEAVRQWRYRPVLLKGVPVQVITEVDVNFTL